VPYVAVAVLLGPEFPSLLGGLIGLAVVTYAARRGFLLPKKAWDFAPRPEWDPGWMGRVDPGDETAMVSPRMGMGRAWSPYLLVAGILVLTRVPHLPLQGFLSRITLSWNDIFGTGVSGSLQPLYLPGTMFIAVVLATYAIHRMSFAEVRESWRVASSQIAGAGVALLFALPLVRVFINSGPAFNDTGLSSMPLTLAESAASLAGSNWPFFAPWIGALGAFVAGSNTVSNLTFALFQFATAVNIGAEPALIVAAQAVGGAAGNMITVHNVVAAAATVGLLGQEGALLRKTILPMTYYCFLTGSLTFIWVHGIGFNLGTVGVLVLIGVLVFVTRAIRHSPPREEAERTPV
jgi:lactate permease